MKMGFKNEILKNYLDSDGLVSIDRNPSKWSTGNGLLYTGLFYTILALRGELDESDRKRFSKAVSACEVRPGLYNRNPNRPDFEAHDDYVGVVCGAFFTGTRFARDVLEYGLARDFHYDNTGRDSGLRSDHSRFVGRIGFYFAAAGEKPGFLRRVGINGGIRGAIDMPFGNAGEKLLVWLQVQVLKKAGLLPIACALFDQHVEDEYGSASGLFCVALRSPGHPFSNVTV